MHKKQGFTLIELLVVIAIIGILSAIGLTALTGAQSKARDTKRKADLGALNSSLTLYLDQNTAFPGADVAGSGATAGPIQTGASGAAMTTAAAAAGGFAIPRPPTSSDTSNNYWYVTDASGSKFALYSRLENNASGATVATWFVSNTKGFSDSIGESTAGHATAPTAANSECVDTATGGAKIYSPCLSQPDM